MYYSLIYTSKATHPMQAADLQDLLSQSITANQKSQITGMLLYIDGQFVNQTGGRFIQVIEGSEDEVRNLYYKITQDERHKNVTLIHEATFDERNFDTWSMGFRHMSFSEYRQTPGSFNLDEKFLHSKAGTAFNLPLTMLKSFYELHMRS